jgi:hypothetical protein
MPILKNYQHETFALSRAAGATLDEAYEDAGYAYDRGHGSRLAARPEVAERIAELRALEAEEKPSGTASVVASLLRIAKTSEDLNSPAGIKEARLTLLEAHRLSEVADRDRKWKRKYP